MSTEAAGPAPRQVVVVGSVNRDYVCRVPSVPGAGETVLGGELSLFSGGKGGNQAVASARMGAPTTLVACVGDDDDGQALLANLAAAGVDTTHVVTLGGVRSGTAFVMVTDDGENSIVVASGANGRLDARRAREAVAELASEGDVVVLQAEIPLESVVAAIEEADRRSARVVLNLAPFRGMPAAALRLSDPLVVNEHEARALLKVADGHQVDVEDLVRSLRSHARSAVLTCGPAGAVAAYDDGVDKVSAPLVQVVDTTGAGDAFTGALAAALSQGADLGAAVRVGVAAGSFAVGRHGAQQSAPTRDQLAPPLEHPDGLL